jgi:hypothetical protein
MVKYVPERAIHRLVMPSTRTLRCKVPGISRYVSRLIP